MNENTTTETHKSPITEFRARWCLNPGLSDAAEYNDPDKYRSFPATRCGLAHGLDWAARQSIEAHGSWGDAGCGLYAVMGDGGELAIVDDDDCAIDGPHMTESRASDLLTEEGELDADDVHAMRGDVWDGHNWVPFVPERALAKLTDEDRYERNGHALIEWDAEGCPGDIRLDEGWEVADEYWAGYGNESWRHGKADLTDREKALDAAEITYDVVMVSDNDIMILVPTDDVARAQEIMERLDDEDGES